MGRTAQPLTHYPPRANWLSRRRNRLVRLIPDWIRNREECRPWPVALLAFFLPGSGFILERKHGWLSWPLLVCTWIALYLFFVNLGEWQSQFWLLISIGLHGYSFSLKLRQALPDFSSSGVAVLSSVSLLCYYALLFAAANTLVINVQYRHRSILVNRFARFAKVEIGETVFYSVPGWQNTLGIILAKGGDRIEFSPQGFLMNGASYSRLASMPKSGELIVPSDNYFIWPATFNLQDRDELTDLYLKASIVSQSQIIGVALKSWFGQKRENL